MKKKTLLLMALTALCCFNLAAQSPCGFSTTITETSGTFTTPVAGADYQWLFCNTGLPINNATGQSYTPTFGGSYAVIITLNGCTDTSGCLQSQSFSATGIDEMDNNSQFKVFNHGNSVSIKNSGADMLAELAIVNANGQTLLQQKAVISSEYKISTVELPAGVYFVLLKTETTNTLIRFFKRL
jgi:hypothetical protein